MGHHNGEPELFSEEWVRSAPRHEDPADVRARRYQAIIAGHERSARTWAPPAEARGSRRRPVLAAVLVTALFGLGALAAQFTSPLGWPVSVGVVDKPPRAVGEQPQRILPAVAPPANAPRAGFTIAGHNPDGSVVGFSPCRTWPVVVNLTRAPSFGYDATVAAVAELQQAMGVPFAVRGDTDEVVTDARAPYQPDRYGEDWAPILIDWQPQEATVLGRGGPASVVDDDGVRRYVSGTVALTTTQAWTPVSLRAVLLHELGHVVGLGHVSDQSQLMYPQAVQGGFAAGDRAGLALLGTAACAAG